MFLQKTFFCLCFAFLGMSVSLTSQSPPSNYIEQYKDIAIREMHRSGIPASITLAQGILESNWGNGSLALNANNHFGIKCKSHWTGPSFYHKDDDYKRGKLIKSCFRSYDSAEDSYVDHSNFLQDNPRYARLFTYDRTDYRRWAHGLKKCGYATDKKYAYKLISFIKKYKLYEYDLAPEEMPMIVASNDSVTPLQQPIVEQEIIVNNTVQLPSTPAPNSPQVFVLPNNYKRGDGLKKFGTKGEQIILNSSSILWNK